MGNLGNVKNQKYRNRNAGNAGDGGRFYIPENVAKHSGKCCQAFREMSPNIPGNVLEYSGEFTQTFRRIYSKHYGECRQAFRRMSSNNPENIGKYSETCRKNHVKSIKTFRWMYIIVLDTVDHKLYLNVEERSLLNSTSKQLDYLLNWEMSILNVLNWNIM